MKRISVFCLVLLQLTLCGIAQAQDLEVQIFTLKYRTADEMIPQVSPLLGKEERLSASGHQLVLVATPVTIDAVSRLLEAVDHPLEQFLVQVRWLEGADAIPGALGYDPKAKRTTLPDSNHVLGNSQSRTLHQLRVVAEEPAFLVTGHDIPYHQEWAAWSGKESSGFATKIGFQKLRSGFSVTVYPVSGNEVTVDLTPQLMAAEVSGTLEPPTLKLSRLSTRTRVPLGVWVDMASFMGEKMSVLSQLSDDAEVFISGQRLQVRISR